jgi:hypothetical protein
MTCGAEHDDRLYREARRWGQAGSESLVRLLVQFARVGGRPESKIFGHAMNVPAR